MKLFHLLTSICLIILLSRPIASDGQNWPQDGSYSQPHDQLHQQQSHDNAHQLPNVVAATDVEHGPPGEVNESHQHTNHGHPYDEPANLYTTKPTSGPQQEQQHPPQVSSPQAQPVRPIALVQQSPQQQQQPQQQSQQAPSKQIDSKSNQNQPPQQQQQHVQQVAEQAQQSVVKLQQQTSQIHQLMEQAITQPTSQQQQQHQSHQQQQQQQPPQQQQQMNIQQQPSLQAAQQSQQQQQQLHPAPMQQVRVQTQQQQQPLQQQQQNIAQYQPVQPQPQPQQQQQQQPSPPPQPVQQQLQPRAQPAVANYPHYHPSSPLYIGHNPFIEILRPHSYADDNIVTLNLSHSHIYEIDSDAFVGQRFEHIDLSNNKLGLIHSRSFRIGPNHSRHTPYNPHASSNGTHPGKPMPGPYPTRRPPPAHPKNVIIDFSHNPAIVALSGAFDHIDVPNCLLNFTNTTVELKFGAFKKYFKEHPGHIIDADSVDCCEQEWLLSYKHNFVSRTYCVHDPTLFLSRVPQQTIVDSCIAHVTSGRGSMTMQEPGRIHQLAIAPRGHSSGHSESQNNKTYLILGGTAMILTSLSIYIIFYMFSLKAALVVQMQQKS